MWLNGLWESLRGDKGTIIRQAVAIYLANGEIYPSGGAIYPAKGKGDMVKAIVSGIAATTAGR